MDYVIREMRNEEFVLLGDFLYEAIYIPDGIEPPPKSVIECPELQEYMILEDYKMEQYVYNEQNGLWYELRGDYYIPCLELPAEKEERPIGVWGQRHLRYIREHKKALYTSLLTSGKLQSYLADVEEQAQALFDRLMKQRAERAGITETLKADNQMEWVQRMNALRSAVIETVNAEVIFV